MLFSSDEHRNHVLTKLSLGALFILLAYDFAIVVIGYFLDQQYSSAATGNPFVRNIIFAVALADMIAIYVIKNLMLKRSSKSQIDRPAADEKLLYKELRNITVVITAMCSAIPVYGLILVILHEKFEVLVFFAAVSLIAYQLFRLRPRDFEGK
jgi:hypothetical protein